MQRQVQCACGISVLLGEEYKGDEVKCPSCGQQISIPLSSTYSSTASATPSVEHVPFTCPFCHGPLTEWPKACPHCLVSFDEMAPPSFEAEKEIKETPKRKKKSGEAAKKKQSGRSLSEVDVSACSLIRTGILLHYYSVASWLLSLTLLLLALVLLMLGFCIGEVFFIMAVISAGGSGVSLIVHTLIDISSYGFCVAPPANTGQGFVLAALILRVFSVPVALIMACLIGSPLFILAVIALSGVVSWTCWMFFLLRLAAYLERPTLVMELQRLMGYWYGQAMVYTSIAGGTLALGVAAFFRGDVAARDGTPLPGWLWCSGAFFLALLLAGLMFTSWINLRRVMTKSTVGNLIDSDITWKTLVGLNWGIEYLAFLQTYRGELPTSQNLADAESASSD